MTEEDFKALSRFKEAYPSWWYRIGVCDISRDFTCAPQADSPEINLAEIGNVFDLGFTCDHTCSITDAINKVMEEIQNAIEGAED